MKLKVSPEHKFTQVYFICSEFYSVSTSKFYSFVQNYSNKKESIIIYHEGPLKKRPKEPHNYWYDDLLKWQLFTRDQTHFFENVFLLFTPRVTTGLGNQGSYPRGNNLKREKQEKSPMPQ